MVSRVKRSRRRRRKTTGKKALCNNHCDARHLAEQTWYSIVAGDQSRSAPPTYIVADITLTLKPMKWLYKNHTTTPQWADDQEKQSSHTESRENNVYSCRYVAQEFVNCAQDVPLRKKKKVDKLPPKMCLAKDSGLRVQEDGYPTSQSRSTRYQHPLTGRRVSQHTSRGTGVGIRSLLATSCR